MGRIADEKKVYQLSQTACKQHDEAVDELSELLATVVAFKPELQKFGTMMAVLLGEFIHWMYEPTGTHPKPSDMVKEAWGEAAAMEMGPLGFPPRKDDNGRKTSD